jgi:hypothetical protein
MVEFYSPRDHLFTVVPAFAGLTVGGFYTLNMFSAPYVDTPSGAGEKAP